MKLYSLILLHTILLIFSQFTTTFADLDSDKQALLAFSNIVPHNPKLDWTNTTDICTSWLGVICDSSGARVTGLRLPSIGLTGPIPPNTIGKLKDLQVLSLRLNRLSGTLPNDILSLRYLHHLFLQHNDFSGSIPESFPSQMNVLDLSFNSFTGQIPKSLQNLTRLTSLNLQNNSLSGRIPNFKFSRLKHLSIGNNYFNGSIPSSFQNFPNSSFIGNSFLCGQPLNPCSAILSPPPATAPLPPTAIISSTKIPLWAIIVMAAGGGVVIILFGIALYFCCLRKRRNGSQSQIPAQGQSQSQSRVFKGKGKFSVSRRSEKAMADYGSEVVTTDKNKKVVFFEGCFYNFDIEDLLRASAEVLGKGSFGISYKATLEKSVMVVVKRLKDAVVGKKEFEEQMEVIGRVDPHLNVVPLRAYYYSKDEKLLVYDYMSNGSLLNLLHGDRGTPSRTPVSWETRIKLALGTAHGIAYIHATGSPKLVHGNIKSANILITQHGDACIADTAIAPMLNFPASTSRYTVGYRAPEVLETRKHTHKSDVYSFGVLLLEMLTGKQPLQSSGREDVVDLPKWVQLVVREEWTAEVFDAELMGYQNIEEEMVQMLQIAMACVVEVPDNRPVMQEVVKMIEEVRLSESGNGSDADRSDNPDEQRA
ncbi:putative inactive receptor kinase At5g58300 [Bidens hawaiensis]|uniref:putative inactive receptor kinase At5g58300 n=1 Tax=Bidens hawaiensis TaxID=980011 RepID=UPI0040490C44